MVSIERTIEQSESSCNESEAPGVDCARDGVAVVLIHTHMRVRRLPSLDNGVGTDHGQT